MKPANLLRSQDGSVKVSDFGLAKQALDSSNQLTQAGHVVGTPYFMSPEQCECKPVDFRSDIYSLGATYYTLLTGVDPFASAGSIVQIMYAHCNGELLDPRDVDPTLPVACSQIIARAMAKLPEDRYQSADEMLADLTALFASLDQGTAEDLRFARPARMPSRRTMLALAGGLLFVAAVAGIGMLRRDVNGFAPAARRRRGPGRRAHRHADSRRHPALPLRHDGRKRIAGRRRHALGDRRVESLRRIARPAG